MEKLHPQFVAEELAKLPYGVVVVSGTNGKTTTTKMAVQLLEAQGLKVFTNRTGSNFVRGVAAALLGEMTLTGKLEADIAVLELCLLYTSIHTRTIHRHLRTRTVLHRNRTAARFRHSIVHKTAV